MSTPGAPSSFCDLARALEKRTAVAPSISTENDILQTSGLGRSLIFVLVDGLGENYLKRLASSSFLNSSKISTLISVFPSTTASAMTSLATGLQPAVHGIPGRYSYNKNGSVHINTLAFRDRFDGKLLTSKLQPDCLWPHRSFIAESGIPAYSIIPQVLRNSPFEKYLLGDNLTDGYNSISGAVESLIGRVKSESTRSFYYLYLWELDSLAHIDGTKSRGIEDLLFVLENELSRLWDKTKSIADVVISADHGHIDAGEAMVITPEHRLMSFLETPPYGEPRAAQLRILPDRLDEFEGYFNEEFGGSFTLSRTQNTAELFGSDSFSVLAEGNFGNYIAIARERNLLIYTPGNPGDAKINKGEHGGLLPDERLIPLIIPT